MKKCCMMLLLAALLAVPLGGRAQGLEELFETVYEGAGEGLQEGIVMAAAGMGEELTLTLTPQDTQLEAGNTLRLTITAGNPRPVETKVAFTLKLPERLTAAQETTWEAALPAAKMDEKSDTLVPSMTTFTREITLSGEGESETTSIECEMSMGTRFYRAQTDLTLCVPDVSVTAQIEGGRNGRMYPGEAYAYRICIVNKGMAPKDIPMEITLPEGVMLTQAPPSGFVQRGTKITGQVRAEAAGEQGKSPSEAVILLPVIIAEDVLDGDEDAMRLMSGLLSADGERVEMPRIQVCGAKISARLIADREELKEGETAKLRVVVVNSGLAPADVRVSCMLPQGLTLAKEAQEKEAQEKEEKIQNQKENEGRKEETESTASEAAVLPPDDSAAGLTEVISAADEPAIAVMSEENRTLMFDVHMDAARETKAGVTANTQVFDIAVQADDGLENLPERLVGTTLAWTVEGGEAQLGEAVAMRVSRAGFLGMSGADWNGMFWATVLLTAILCCLYAATHRDKEEDFCCD